MRLTLPFLPETSTNLGLVILISALTFSPLIFFGDLRYHVILFPIFFILSGFIVSKIFRFNKLAGIISIFLLVFTNLLNLQIPIRSLFLEFLGEAKNPYTLPNEAVANFLNQNALEGDTAFINLDHYHLDLIFLTNNKIRFVNRLNPSDKKIFPKNFGKLPQYIYSFTEEPDWIINYSKRRKDGSYLTRDYRSKYPMGSTTNGIDLKNDYRETVLPVYFYDMSRPEINGRSFVKIVPDENDQIFIYRRIEHKY
jgi:hypothetical protein